jgi:hypothetical protein
MLNVLRACCEAGVLRVVVLYCYRRSVVFITPTPRARGIHLVPLATKAHGGVGGATCHVHLLQKEHVKEVEEGGERREERSDVGDAVVGLVQALDDVGDEVRVGDWGADLGQGISRRLLEDEVIGDGLVFLLDVEEFVGEVNVTDYLVVVEDTVNSRPNRVRGGAAASVEVEVGMTRSMTSMAMEP